MISWLQSPSAVILEPKKIKSVTVLIISPSIFHEMMGQDKKIAHMADFNSKKEYRCIEMDSGNESKCYNFNDSTEICGI